MKSLRLPICALLLVAAGACSRTQQQETAGEEAAEQHNIVYGINADNYRTETGEVGSGETLGKILNGFGVSPLTIDRLDKASKDIFPLRNIRHEDSLYAPHLDYLVYERNVAEYVVFGFHDDSVSVRTGEKQFTVRRTKKSATINSSLWGAIMEQELPYALAAEMEDIYQWTVDFFGIQKGDNFTVIYDERFIDDSVSVGIGRIWGAKFCQGGKEYYAIPFRQGGKIRYWEYDGASLRKQMLKAPLKYSRISSKFTYAQASDLQGIPAAYGRRLRCAERHARACRRRRRGHLQRLGRRRRQHAQDQACGQPDDGLPAPERLCQRHFEGFARIAGPADRLCRFDGRFDGTASRLPHLEKRHADRPAESSAGTRRADRKREPGDVRIRTRPHRGRAERRGEGRRAHHAAGFARNSAGSGGFRHGRRNLGRRNHGSEITHMTAAETDEKKVQPAVATKAVERRETEKPGTEHKAPETKTEEAPAEKGSASAAESNSPATKGHAAAAEGSTPTTKGNTPAVEENAAVAEGSVSAAERNTPVAETPGSAESGTAKTSGCGEAINERFVRFLRRHHVLTLATVAEGVPYCSNAFYCYDKERNLLVFTSDPATRHAQEMERNPRIAASVVLETKIVGRVQGLQLCGTAARADETARRAYLKRFPYAALAELTLWAIRPDYMKLTDNTLGFGKKLIWNDKLESSS